MPRYCSAFAPSNAGLESRKNINSFSAGIDPVMSTNSYGMPDSSKTLCESAQSRQSSLPYNFHFICLYISFYYFTSEIERVSSPLFFTNAGMQMRPSTHATQNSALE